MKELFDLSKTLMRLQIKEAVLSVDEGMFAYWDTEIAFHIQIYGTIHAE